MIQLWGAQVCPGRLIPQRTHSPPILEQALKFGLMIRRNDDIRCCVQLLLPYILAKTYRLLSYHTLSANSPCQTYWYIHTKAKMSIPYLVEPDSEGRIRRGAVTLIHNNRACPQCHLHTGAQLLHNWAQHCQGGWAAPWWSPLLLPISPTH